MSEFSTPSSRASIPAVVSPFTPAFATVRLGPWCGGFSPIAQESARLARRPCHKCCSRQGRRLRPPVRPQSRAPPVRRRRAHTKFLLALIDSAPLCGRIARSPSSVVLHAIGSIIVRTTLSWQGGLWRRRRAYGCASRADSDDRRGVKSSSRLTPSGRGLIAVSRTRLTASQTVGRAIAKRAPSSVRDYSGSPPLLFNWVARGH